MFWKANSARNNPRNAVTRNRLYLAKIGCILLVIGLSSLACGGRVFSNLHVFSLEPAKQSEVYNQITDTILVNDVWVFRADGTFDATLDVNGEKVELSGTYEGDDVGDQFIFSLDLDQDGNFQDEVIANVIDDSFSWIEWEIAGQTIRYVLVVE